MLGRLVPNFEGIANNGKAINSEYFKGKVTLINFMYIGCPPCMQELPMLLQLYKRLDSSRSQILCIAPHTKEQIEAFNSNKPSIYSVVRNYFGADSIPYAILPECPLAKRKKNPRTMAPECDLISSKFKVDGYPMSFLVDGNLRIVKVYEGFATGRDSLYISQITKDIESIGK